MYRAREKQMSIYDYLPPYHGELCNANRWVRLAAAIDWDGFEKAYSALFAPGGKVALPARVALGCRIIQLHYAASVPTFCILFNTFSSSCCTALAQYCKRSNTA